MAKRIKLETLKRFAIVAGLMGVPMGIVMFSYLYAAGSVSVAGYDYNQICGGNTMCYLDMNQVCFNEDVFIYPMDAGVMINASPEDAIDSIRILRKWGTGYREIPLETGCTGSWCGCFWCSASRPAVYSYAFREKKCYDIRYEIYKSQISAVKWNINPSGEFKPVFEYIYEKKTKEIPVYKEKIVKVPAVYVDVNDTWTEAYEYTIQEFSHYEKQEYDGKIIGVKSNKKEYLTDDYHINRDNEISVWSIPIGDRNKDDPNLAECRPYEIEKGVCYKEGLI